MTARALRAVVALTFIAAAWALTSGSQLAIVAAIVLLIGLIVAGTYLVDRGDLFAERGDRP